MTEPPLTPQEGEELLRLARFLRNPDEGANPNGPIPPVPEKFGHCPEHVRKFIGGLGEEDVADWLAALRWFRAVRVVLRFLKGLGVAVGGAFAATVAAVKGIPGIIDYFRSG